jgi:hypothetical protein
MAINHRFQLMIQNQRLIANFNKYLKLVINSSFIITNHKRRLIITLKQAIKSLIYVFCKM